MFGNRTQIFTDFVCVCIELRFCLRVCVCLCVYACVHVVKEAYGSGIPGPPCDSWQRVCVCVCMFV